MAAGLPNPGPDVVAYDPPVFDVVSAKDLEPADAFADFPLTVLP